MNFLFNIVAQCPCGGAGEGGASTWAALVPAAAVLFFAVIYDLYSRKSSKPANPEDATENREGRSDDEA